MAPAMNTLMYTNPFTEKHLKILKEMGVYVIEPIVKTLMCQESGIGAMEEVGKISIYVVNIINNGHGGNWSFRKGKWGVGQFGDHCWERIGNHWKIKESVRGERDLTQTVDYGTKDIIGLSVGKENAKFRRDLQCRSISPEIHE